MAAMSTSLTEFSDNGNSRTYSLPLHTVLKPQLVLEKRKVPSGSQTVAEDTITVLTATEDSAGVKLAQRVSFTVTIRRPINGLQTDIDAALVIFRDIIAGDEFTNTVNSQEYLV
jgi:hypothetical protein